MADLKKRHGCLTAWLIFMIVVNSLATLFYLLAGEIIRQNLPKFPVGMIPVLAGLCAFNVVCAVALFKWKLWGFYGVVASSVLALVANLSLGIHPVRALLGLLGVILLYAVLQIGNENKGWTQLE